MIFIDDSFCGRWQWEGIDLKKNKNSGMTEKKGNLKLKIEIFTKVGVNFSFIYMIIRWFVIKNLIYSKHFVPMH